MTDFIKVGDIAFSITEIQYIDIENIDRLEVLVALKCGKYVTAKDIEAIELIMKTMPAILEGKRLKWYKYTWAIHNLFAHPAMQILAFLGLYKAAFWIHDKTVPKPRQFKRPKKF